MSEPDHYQAIVIGSGQGGTPLCMALATPGFEPPWSSASMWAGPASTKVARPRKPWSPAGASPISRGVALTMAFSPATSASTWNASGSASATS